MNSQYILHWLFTTLMLNMLGIVLVLKVLENLKSKKLDKMDTDENKSVQI